MLAMAESPLHILLHLQFQSGDKEMMIQINVCSSLKAQTQKRATKLPRDTHVVDLVPRRKVCRHQSCFLYPFMLENTISDDMVTCGAHVGESLSVVVHLT
ncbi:hypothetical protein DPMN_054754 [Dreissena polymorpha]|uniref:Uncharacterized protein n=1 Tax=Dreissena polymorpha TaxID=45954 RepID=A0A9D4CPH2_DREPO|nr:hypothetical protein DPMN_054754 [Dreissena polymorpha]